MGEFREKSFAKRGPGKKTSERGASGKSSAIKIIFSHRKCVCKWRCRQIWKGHALQQTVEIRVPDGNPQEKVPEEKSPEKNFGKSSWKKAPGKKLLEKCLVIFKNGWKCYSGIVGESRKKLRKKAPEKTSGKSFR